VTETPGDITELLSRKVAELRESDPDDPRLRIADRCDAANIEYRWRKYYADEDLFLQVAIPNGRDKRWLRVRLSNAGIFESSGFESVIYLGEYESYYYRDSGLIESVLTSRTASVRALSQIPGSERLGRPLGERQEVFEDEAEEHLDDNRRGWRLQYALTPTVKHSVEIGTSTDRLSALTGRGGGGGLRRPIQVTLKIGCDPELRHDDALEIFERISTAVLFELDVSFGQAFEVGKRRQETYRRDAPLLPAPTSAPAVPRNRYGQDPMTLYRYARSSEGTPLLEYLAYYQVLEYYFPSYGHREALNRIRLVLRDPRFQPDDDTHLSRVLAIANRTGNGLGNERDQLKATISYCLVEPRLREFFENNPEVNGYFSGAQKVKGVKSVDLLANRGDLIGQVSDRIYDIRCRIVHAKEDGGGGHATLLLPFSKEANEMWADIELVRFIAQEVLIGGAQTSTI
jgi:hypothetical protein